jgi:hypothetical protein
MTDNTGILKVALGLAAQTQSAGTVDGTGIDVGGFDEVMVILNAGGNGASGTLDVKVQESDAVGGSYTDVAGAAFTQVTEANDVAVYVGRLQLKGARKKFVRVRSVVAVADCAVGVVFVLGGQWKQPSQAPQWTA